MLIFQNIVLATVSTSLATLILMSLTLSKDEVDTLVEHFDPLDEKSLRVAFIHFILAFIIEQSPKVIEKLLGKKGTFLNNNFLMLLPCKYNYWNYPFPSF